MNLKNLQQTIIVLKKQFLVKIKNKANKLNPEKHTNIEKYSKRNTKLNH